MMWLKSLYKACFAGYILFIVAFFPTPVSAQGSTCNDAIDIPLDGVLRTYSSSGSLATAVLCADNGSTPVTFFKFTTNASAQCPLFDINVQDGQAAEVAFYTSCGGNMNNNLDLVSSMCFQDGTGLWAPAETYVLSPNTVYILRIKTSVDTDIEIAGQYFTPPNDDCTGALSISPFPIADNNSCHHGGPGVFASQLCAFTLENTAFYQYHVASTGISIINITDIACDNAEDNNNNGFQIGFFTGTCFSLTPVSCSTGSGNIVQVTTEVLPAGTKVYVAVDGVAGANCKYLISATNAVVLNDALKYFTVWKKNQVNIIKWKSSQRDVSLFEIERSADGITFTSIGKIYQPTFPGTSEFLEFEDGQPYRKSFYRLKQVGKNERIFYSHILEVDRSSMTVTQTNFTLSASALHIQFDSEKADIFKYKIMFANGQLVKTGITNIPAGFFTTVIDISGLPSGAYIIVFENRETLISHKLVKTY